MNTGASPNAVAQLIGLDHYAINVADLERSAQWYEKVFHFEILHKWNTTWMVGRGNVKVGLFLRPDAAPVEDINKVRIIQHVAFLVDGDKFDLVVKELRDKGVTVEGPDDTGIAHSIFFNDPDGHLLEITTYHPTDITPKPTRLSSTRFSHSH
jgi:metallothiol transferase